MNIEIIYEDDYLIVINKSAGIEVDNNLIKLLNKQYEFLNDL